MNTSRHLPRPVLLAVAGTALAGLLSACAGSTADNAVSGDPAVTTTPGASPSGFAPAPTVAPTGSAAATTAPATTAPATTANASTAPATSAAPVAPPAVGTAATMPAVAGAANLAKEPKVSAGKKPAPTRLVIRDLVVGTGAAATPASTVSVQYVGANYADGKVFDASWTDSPGKPSSFSLASVIPGFAQGIAGMKVGGRREIVIPPALGYGQQASGPIVANETLVFVVDLVKVG